MSTRTIEKYPLLSREGLVGSLFYPEDGRGNATDTTMSLARGARQRGVQIFENTPVERDSTRRPASQRCRHGQRIDRGGVCDQLRRDVGPAVGRAGRRARAVAGAGPLLRHHRSHPRARPRPADHQELRRLDLREERGRRPDGRVLRAGQLPMAVARDPRRPGVRAAPRRLGASRAVLRDRHETHPRADDCRHPVVLRRTGELHARRRVPLR